MARKNEFQPDKPRLGLMDWLHLTQKQRKNLLKWVLYGALLLVLSLLQDVVLSRVRIFGATTDLVPCALFLVCLLEGTHSGSVFALVASLLYLFSGTAPGPYAMVLLTAIAIGITIFRQAYLQKGFPAAMLCVCLAMLIYEISVFGVGLFLNLTIFSRLPGFLITTLLSLLFAPALYPLVLAIETIGGEPWKE